MQRTYLAFAGLALAASSLPVALPPLGRAASLFQSMDVEAGRFAVLAKPVGDNDWTLLVLEQLATQPLCWETRKDGLVDPVLNRFDYTGICNRYLDSNGYSLRVADEDLGTGYRLRVQQVGSRLELQATSPRSPAILLVGRADVPLRDRDGFVSLQLEPGWLLKRRTYENRPLTHLYFSSDTPLDQLIARAGGGQPYRPPSLGNFDPDPSATADAPRIREDDPMAPGGSGRAIALQVIPFSD
jgi:hypothetical protein